MPDDPVLQHSASIHIDRSPDEVYAMVSDIGRMGEWSPVCTGGTWDDGAGPWAGAWFTGHNVTPERSWDTRVCVLTAEPGAEFTFAVNTNRARWSYTMVPEPGGTRLTESWDFLPDGLAFFAERFGDDAPAQIALRSEAARTGIPTTLDAIKAVAEAG